MTETIGAGTASNKPSPLDFTHHFSNASKKRVPNVLKDYYKYLQIPGIGSLAGGLPYPGYFPFETLEFSILGPDGLSTLRHSSDSRRCDALGCRIPRKSQEPKLVRKVDLDTALQYGSAQGYLPLYALLRNLTTSVYHPNIPYEGGADIIIDGGSADGLSKVYDIFFNYWAKGLDNVADREGLLVEEFVYAPPLAQIKPRNVNVVPVKVDGEGILAYQENGLFDVLKNWDSCQGKRPHVLYLIPTGQNPTSGVLSLVRRKEIYEICSQFDVIIVEDDPYWNLYYPNSESESSKYRKPSLRSNFPEDKRHKLPTQSLEGSSTGHRFLDELVPSFLSIDVDGRVVRLDTFSKTIAPGCRLGWITAQPRICEQIFRVTDATTQQPSGFVQAIVTQLILDPAGNSLDDPPSPNNSSGNLQKAWGVVGWLRWLEGLRDRYEHRMITMATILETGRFLTSDTTDIEMFTFAWPRGGMFLWVKVNIIHHPLATSIALPRLMMALWVHCINPPHLVLTNPGKDFAATDAVRERDAYLYLRLCFAAVQEEVLAAKSQSFVDGCRSFWAITDAEEVNQILREEDALKNLSTEAREVAEMERLVIEED